MKVTPTSGLTKEEVDRLVSEGDQYRQADVLRRDSALAENVVDGVPRVARVVLHAAEPLLLGGGDDPPVLDEARRGVVVPGGDAEDVHAGGRPIRRAGR